MARDYRAEYRARMERSRQRGFGGYTHERRERQRLQAIESHPTLQLRENFLRPGEWTDQPHGLQGPFGPSPEPDWDYYWPTRTINPPRPRTLQARYSRQLGRLEVIFRDGTPWHYDDIPDNIWTAFKRNESPGRFINATLNYFPYGHGGWGSIVGEE